MPVYPNGTFVKEAEWNRLISSIPARYTVYKDGSLYRAECHIADGTDYDDSDATDLIEAVIESFDSRTDGYKAGKIHFAPGVYLVDDVQFNKPNVIFEGEGRATEFRPKTPSSTTQLITVSTPDNDAISTHASVIRDMIFYNPDYASYPNINAIYYKNALASPLGIIFPMVQNCWFIVINGITTDTTGFTDWAHQLVTGIRVLHCTFEKPPTFGIRLYNCMDGWLDDIYATFENTATVGIEVNLSAHQFSSGFRLDNVTILHPKTGIKYVGPTAEGWFHHVVTDLCVDYGIHFKDVDRAFLHGAYSSTGGVGAGTGIYLEDSYDNRLISCTVYNCLRGIHSADYVDADHYNYFTNTISTGCGADWYNINTLDRFTHCNYIVTNSGTSTGTGAQQTLAHGLNTTPDRILLGNLEDGANPYQSAAADATNIYITAVNTLDYCWKAWKHPNG